MARLPAPIIALLICSLLAVAQEDPAGANAQERRSVEALRDLAKGEVRKMEALFEDQLTEALIILRETPRSADTAMAMAARRKLAPWANVFPERFIQLIVEAKALFDLRAHLVDVITLTGNPQCAERLAALIGTEGDDLDRICVEGIGYIPGATTQIQQRLITLAAQSESSATRGAVMLALARLKSPAAAPMARATIKDSKLPAERVVAVQALAIAPHAPREDVRLTRKILSEDNLDNGLRVAVLQALREYEPSSENRRILHRALSEEPTELIAAALHSLETVASKESSKGPLIKLIKRKSVDRALRDKAARILCALGLKEGARILVEPFKHGADGERSSNLLQEAAADAYYDLHDFEDAIVYYRRACALVSGSRRARPHVSIARCYARMGSFDKAQNELKKAGYDSFHNFADDPAFTAMKEDPKWGPLFTEDSGE